VTAALRRARLAVAAVFFVNGVVFATWAVRIPAVQERLDLSPGALGVVLLALAGGAMAALPLSGALVVRYGSRRVIRAALIIFCLTLPLVALSPGVIHLVVALAVFGAGNSALDVAMNVQGVQIERRYGRHILAGFHGLFSIGGLTGALIGSAAAAAGIGTPAHFVVAAGVLLCVGLSVTRWLLPDDPKSALGPTFARPTRAVAILGAIAFCALLAEGAVNDWSAVYLRDALGAGSGLAGMGFAAFSLTMAGGRLVADRVVERVGPVRFIQIGGFLATAGLALALLVDHPVAGVACFGLVGAGLAGVVPVVFSSTGHRDKADDGAGPGPAIAAISTVGYLGFLGGPPVIGALAQLLTLRGALWVVVVLAGLMVILARGLASDAHSTSPLPRHARAWRLGCGPRRHRRARTAR
jgi:MFS family permease